MTGLREKLNRNAGLTNAVAALVILVAAIFVLRSLFGGNGKPVIPKEEFYSDDDGQTFFTAERGLIPPFDHNGKQAYRAQVFKHPGGKPFVGVLEGFTPEAKKKIEAAKNVPPSPNGMTPEIMAAEEARMSGMIVKKPGDKQWIPMMDPKAMTIYESLKGSDGQFAEPQFPR